MHACVVAACASALALVAGLVASGTSSGASSSVVVTMDLMSHISFTDDCTDAQPAYALGTVLPGDKARTATGADVCRFTVSSSNDTAMLRMFQSDGTGSAMGSRWSLRSVSLGIPWMSMHMRTATSGWAVNSWGRVNETSDGGATWTQRLADGNMEIAAAFDANIVVAAGFNGSVRRSTNGGGSWGSITLPGSYSQRLHDIEVLSATDAVLVGADGAIFTTGDAGATWTAIATGVSQDFYSVDASSALDVVAGSMGGPLLVSDDGGGTWSSIAAPSSVKEIAMVSPTEIYVANDELLYHTTNGGGSWTKRGSTLRDEPWEALSTTQAGGIATGGRRGTVGTSPDGVSWTHAAVPHQDHWVDIERIGATNELVAFGRSGAVIASTDDGATWTQRRVGDDEAYFGVAAPEDGHLVAVGSPGLVRTSVDNGNSWTTRATPVTTPLRAVDGVGNTIVAVGLEGTILRSTNGGSSWSQVASPTSEHLWATSFAPGGTTAWAVGDSGTVLRSTDAGASWAAQGSSTTEHLWSVLAESATTAYAGGDNARFIETTNGGTTWTTRRSGGIEHEVVWEILPGAGGTIVITDGYDGALSSADGGLSWSPLPSLGGRWGRVMASDGEGTLQLWETGAWRWSGDSGASWSSTNWGSRRITDAVYSGGTFVAVGTSGAVDKVRTGNTLADYALGVTDWTDGASTFGACLQALSGASSVADWSVDGDGDCTTSDADPWNAIPTSPAKVAHTTAAGGTATTDLVFGARVPTTISPGSYVAPIVVDALAPDV